MLGITLYVPGLFDVEIEADRPTELATLELLLARGQKKPVRSIPHNAALCELFGYVHGVDEDIPMAAIGRLIDDEMRPEGYWMRADPVHLHADQKSISLLDVGNLSLTQHDALALAACVQQSFSELGWELEVPVPTRWYVKMDSKPQIRTTEIQAVMGKEIQQYLPTGADAVLWHRLMNEIQVQLHNADINKLREERGDLPVNSLWLWGTGTLPGLLERCWTRVYSDDNNTLGLSMLSNTPGSPLPGTAGDIFIEDNRRADVLVVMSDFQTTMLQRAQRRQQLLEFENNWCITLLDRLREGKLHSLSIITRKWEFRINKLSMMKFWVRPTPFAHYTR